MSDHSKGKEVRWEIVFVVMSLVLAIMFVGFCFWLGFIYPEFFFNPESLAEMKPMNAKANSLYYETYTLLDNPKLKWTYQWKNSLWKKAQMIHDTIHSDYLQAMDDNGVSISERAQDKEEIQTLEKCLEDLKTFPNHPSGYCVRGDFRYDSSIVDHSCGWQGKCPTNFIPLSASFIQSSPDVVGALLPALVNRNDSNNTTPSESESHPVVEEAPHVFGGHAAAE